MKKLTIIALALTARLAGQALEVTPTGVAYGNAGTRTEYRDNPGTQGGRSGFFEAPSPTGNWYFGANNWQHLIEARHSNTAVNYAMQICGSFFDQNLYFRKTAGNAATAWSRVVSENSSGNVVIGSSAVSDVSRLYVFRAGENSDPGVRIASDLGWLSLNARSPTNAWTPMVLANDKAIIFTNGTPETGDFAIGPWSSTMKGIRIVGGSGNVGVGTPNPTHKLTVAGDVRATSFISNTKTYADYVLAPDYDLAPLSEVEAHIKEKGHLPGIPSEAEAVANGIDLADMQVKLLGKVEELTLHLIALEKQVRDQQARIHELESGGN